MKIKKKTPNSLATSLETSLENLQAVGIVSSTRSISDKSRRGSQITLHLSDSTSSPDLEDLDQIKGPEVKLRQKKILRETEDFDLMPDAKVRLNSQTRNSTS